MSQGDGDFDSLRPIRGTVPLRDQGDRSGDRPNGARLAFLLYLEGTAPINTEVNIRVPGLRLGTVKDIGNAFGSKT